MSRWPDSDRGESGAAHLRVQGQRALFERSILLSQGAAVGGPAAEGAFPAGRWRAGARPAFPVASLPCRLRRPSEDLIPASAARSSRSDSVGRCQGPFSRCGRSFPPGCPPAAPLRVRGGALPRGLGARGKEPERCPGHIPSSSAGSGQRLRLPVGSVKIL